MNFINPEIPYNELPLLPPVVIFNSERMLKHLVKAHRNLAELKGYSAMLPDKSLMLNTITLQEAKESSAIENIVTTHDRLYSSFVLSENKIDSATKEVLRYRKALWKGYEAVKRSGMITTNIIIDIQRELEQNDAGIRKLTGTALINDLTKETVYTPPVGEQTIRRLLSNLEKYINSNDEIDPLVKMAVIHYQFESIHPFYDGNGRTGRIINVLFLILKQLIDSPILYLSGYIIKTKTEYYKLLQNVRTDNAWDDWIEYMLVGIEQTAVSALGLIRSIRELIDKTIEESKAYNPKIYSKELIEIIFTNVYTKIGVLVERGIASRNIAGKYLKSYVSMGLLEERRLGKEVLYINKPLFDLLKNS